MHDQYPVVTSDTNHELLETSELGKSELGTLLIDAYHAALELDPRLSEIKIVELDSSSHHDAFARPKWYKSNESGQHEVHIRLQDLGGILDHFAGAINESPGDIDIISQRLGVEPAEFTPQLLYIFTTLHEIGHSSDYLRNENDHVGYDSRNLQDKRAQPLGNVQPIDYLDPKNPIRQYILDNKQAYFVEHGVSSLKELFNKHVVSHRYLGKEKFADDFAVEVFAREPMLLMQLMRDLVMTHLIFSPVGKTLKTYAWSPAG